MKPPIDNDGKETLETARHPGAVDEDVVNRHGVTVGTQPVVPPRRGSWDVDVDAQMREETVPVGTAKKATSKTATVSRQKARRIQKALMLRIQGYSNYEISLALGVAESTVTGWLTTHRRQVSKEELEDYIDQSILPMAVENIAHGVQAGDKDYTLAVANGRGVFKRHSEGDGRAPTEIPTMRIVFEAQTTAQAAQAHGTVVGVVAHPDDERKALPAPKPVGAASTVPQGEVVGAPAIPTTPE